MSQKKEQTKGGKNNKVSEFFFTDVPYSFM